MRRQREAMIHRDYGNRIDDLIDQINDLIKEKAELLLLILEAVQAFEIEVSVDNPTIKKMKAVLEKK